MARGVLAVGAAAAAAAWYVRRMDEPPINWPTSYDSPPEAWRAWRPPSTCATAPTEGAVALRELVLDTYGGADGGILRECPAGAQPTSSHHEGRAWDWFPPDRATADELVQLLAANDGELSRRMGIHNIIWYERIWSQTSHGSWRTYRHASSPNDTLAHRDHVHFELTTDGAAMTTSFWRAYHGERITRDDLGEARQAQQKVPARRTPATAKELRDALCDAHSDVFGGRPTRNRLRLAWALVGHETAGTESMWNHNVGNIACTADHPKCHRLLTHDPSRHPSWWRSYDSLRDGARDWWSLLSRRYGAALVAADGGDSLAFARALRERDYYVEQPAAVYAAGLDRHAAVFDREFPEGACGGGGGRVLLPVLALLIAGGAYVATRGA